MINNVTKTAFIEVADVSGLHLLHKNDRDPYKSSSVVSQLFKINDSTLGSWLINQTLL